MFLSLLILLGCTLFYQTNIGAQNLHYKETFTTHAHHQHCGTQATPNDVIRQKAQQVHTAPIEHLFLQNYSSRQQFPILNIPIKAHIVRQSNGIGGLPISELNKAITIMNSKFANANMQFFLCGSINYIDNNTFYNFHVANHNAITTAHDVPNAINIYFFGTISGVCGYTYFPNPNGANIMINNNCVTNTVTLSHEMGHFYALYHTHGKTNGGTTDELVNGSNCTDHGDDICDTPADPNLGGMVSQNCLYTGNAVDSNGHAYTPAIDNLMSYAPIQCCTAFSPGQCARMYATAISNPYRTGLHCPNNDVAISSILHPQDSSTTCDSIIAPEVLLTNEGTDTITNVTINYQLNNSIINSFNWTGVLMPTHSISILLPSISIDTSTALLNVYTSNPNMALDMNHSNDTMSTTTNYQPLFDSNILNNGDGSATAVPIGGMTPYSYQWDTNANSQTTATAFNLTSGSYSITITDANGCTTTSTSTITISGSTSPPLTNDFTVHPNPNNGIFTIKVNLHQKQAFSIQVVDVLGKSLKTMTSDANQQTIPLDLTSLGANIYFIILRTDQAIITKKIVVQP